MSRATWDLKRFLTMMRLMQAITVWSREMMRAMRAGTTRLGPEVMKGWLEDRVREQMVDLKDLEAVLGRLCFALARSS